MASVPNKSQAVGHNCGDRNCPKHRPQGANTMRNAPKSAVPPSTDNNCPKPRNGTPSSSNPNSASSQANAQKPAGNVASLKRPEVPDFNMEELVQNVQTKLRIAVSKPPAQGSNNVMVTRNINSVKLL